MRVVRCRGRKWGQAVAVLRLFLDRSLSSGVARVSVKKPSRSGAREFVLHAQFGRWGEARVSFTERRKTVGWLVARAVRPALCWQHWHQSRMRAAGRLHNESHFHGCCTNESGIWTVLLRMENLHIARSRNCLFPSPLLMCLSYRGTFQLKAVGPNEVCIC